MDWFYCRVLLLFLLSLSKGNCVSTHRRHQLHLGDYTLVRLPWGGWGDPQSTALRRQAWLTPATSTPGQWMHHLGSYPGWRTLGMAGGRRGARRRGGGGAGLHAQTHAAPVKLMHEELAFAAVVDIVSAAPAFAADAVVRAHADSGVFLLDRPISDEELSTVPVPVHTRQESLLTTPHYFGPQFPFLGHRHWCNHGVKQTGM
jgi:hypothetical protein